MAVKTVVLTGVSRGLGLAMVREFIQRGHRVLGCARSEPAIAQLSQTYGDPHVFQVVDVTDNAAVKAWAEQALAANEAPDLLLNNAALVNNPSSLWQVSAKEFDRVIDVNIKGVANVLRYFVPAMVKKQRGIIVNFSSGWGRSTSPGVGPYCATKWAIEGLTRSLAQELPAGMAAIPLNPGIIHTDMLEICFGEAAASYDSPQDWARRAVPFLLSLSASDNGSPLTVPD